MLEAIVIIKQSISNFLICFLVANVNYMLEVYLAGHWEEGERRGGQYSFSKISIYYILRSSIYKELILTMEKYKGIYAN
jgi:hypothetical protein